MTILDTMTKQKFHNMLYTNDNLYVLSGLNSESVDLIYLDPPFNSKRMYSAPVGSKAAGASFKDMWTWQDVDEYYLDTLADQFPTLARYIANVGIIHSKPMMAYLTYMSQRIIEMRRVLKDTGSIYLHCDPTASHYLKLLLDGIFGKQAFVNEIVWRYTGNSVPKYCLPKKHDTIYWYCKGMRPLFFPKNILLPYSELTEKRYNHIDKEGRRYKISALRNGKQEIVYMKDGKYPDDVWDIPVIRGAERTGYPTQKPLALLKRIILASSSEGDTVLDPFCGCATTCVAAQQLQRKWIGIDLEKQTVSVLIQRLSDAGRLFRDFIATDHIPKRSDVHEAQPSKSVKQQLYKEQNGQCNACGTKFEIHHLEIDHIVPKSKGGGDYYENYQLLCGSCNRIKGDRTMEYLRLKIETRERMMKAKIFFGE